MTRTETARFLSQMQTWPRLEDCTRIPKTPRTDAILSSRASTQEKFNALADLARELEASK